MKTLSSIHYPSTSTAFADAPESRRAIAARNPHLHSRQCHAYAALKCQHCRRATITAKRGKGRPRSSTNNRHHPPKMVQRYCARGPGRGASLSTHSSLLTMALIMLIAVSVRNADAVLDVSWWSSVAQLSTSNLLAGSAASRAPACIELTGLSPGQARICELFKDHMPAVGHGAKEAIHECEHQFRNDRWNCSTPPEAGIIGPIHKLGTREAAFTYAILAAGVTHEIGRRCRLGLLKSCGCSPPPKSSKMPPSSSSAAFSFSSSSSAASANEEWTWGGCGDNVDYGYRFSKDFIDVREKEEGFKRDAGQRGRSLMNRWNNEVGRKILKRHTRPKCKCHGVSGSCNLKTCWMQLPSVRHVGNVLHAKYRTARRIQINARGNMQFDDDNDNDGRPSHSVSSAAASGMVSHQLPSSSLSLPSQKPEDGERLIIESGGGGAAAVSSRPRKRSVASSPPKSTKKAGGHHQHHHHHHQRQSPTELVYLDDSPDYCREDRSLSTIGTRGRVCVKDASSSSSQRQQQQQQPNSCDLLCCGRGYDSYTQETEFKCDCKFQWCCQVVCQTCRNVTQIHICK